jgi:positive regulator of sigma E activity
VRRSVTPFECLTVDGVVRGASLDGRVEIEFARPHGCRGCEGACLWRKLPASARATLLAARPFTVGDRVTVSLPHREFVLSGLLLHGLPWAALLAGALVGFAVTGSDLGSLLGAAAGVASSIAASPVLRRRIERTTLAAVTVAPCADRSE